MFQKSVGFRNVDKILSKMKQVAQPTLKINDLGQYPMRDPGEMSNMTKQRRNTTPLQWPERFGDVVHFDIVYSSGTAIGGYRYDLCFVDRRSRHIKQYPLKSLASDELLKALHLFLRDMGGRYPDTIIEDRDLKLMGGQVAVALEGINEYREEKDQSVVTGAPTGRQNKNGLPGIKCRHVLTMVSNWLTSNYLPRKFWYFAINMAIHVSNCMNILLENGQWTTPHEEKYGTKPDWCNLAPVFSFGYIRRNQYSNKQRATADSQSIMGICVGNDTKSYGLLFYLSTSKKLMGLAY